VEGEENKGDDGSKERTAEGGLEGASLARPNIEGWYHIYNIMSRVSRYRQNMNGSTGEGQVEEKKWPARRRRASEWLVASDERIATGEENP